VAIERSGRAKDGSYYTMRGFSMDSLVAPIDSLLTLDCQCSGESDPTGARRTCTGIGDGGNEAGMGKVLGAVQAHIPNGQLIASVTTCDALITAGVSNWGGYGLVAAAEVLLKASAGDSQSVDRQIDLVPTADEERAVAEAMICSGARDGISGALDGSVDGMPLETHLAVLGELRAAARG
jgi:hypothetical protein